MKSHFRNPRRNFLGSLSSLGLGAGMLGLSSFSSTKKENTLHIKAKDELMDMKITRVRFYEAPSRSMVNQSAHVVTIETDKGITGIGEGGTAFLVKQLGGLLIGQNPLQIERLWNIMYRGHFYPPGREKTHALGALDLALWDIKGKVLGVPVHMLIGGKARNHIECYCTGFRADGDVAARAKACVDYGFRAYRVSVNDPRDGKTFNTNHAVSDTAKKCEAIRKSIGPDADWCIDFHTRLDQNDAIRLSSLIEDLEPYFVEDLVRSEYPDLYKLIRPQVKVPIAVGEHFGDKWDINVLIEKDLIDYSRVSLPNAGGITEYLKIAALCETHYVGQIPHFTGPIATAALVHTSSVFSGPVMMEMLGNDKPDLAHLPESYDLKNGKMYPNDRPGLGVELNTKPLKLVEEVTEYEEGVPQFFREDGSFTNW
ncbi:MAG: mandelate racemase/muconate lactonizing enzyme family protein [Cyclobacteriaceae bacterium]